MNFLNPIVLVALATALVPLLLHFLTLRKLRPFPFSSVRLLKELQQSTVRRLRLRQLLLLAVRMALIASVVLAFARPVLPGKVPLIGDRAPVSIVIVVDNSASMQVSDMQGERFRRLQQHAERFIRSLRTEDEVLLLPVVAPPQWQYSTWGHPRGALLEALAKLSPQPHQGNLLTTLRQTASLLREARHLHRLVVVLSDFQESALPQLPNEPRLFDARTSVYAVDVGYGNPLRAGIVVDSVALETQLRSLGEPVTVIARLRSFGGGNAEALVSLFWDRERVAQQRVLLQEREVRTLQLTGIPRRAGFFHATVIAEGDVHTAGSRRFAGFAIPEPFPVGVIADGAALNYILSALSAFPAGNAPAWAESLSPTALITGNVKRFPVLVIASTELTQSHLERLEMFLQAGGNVVLFAAGGHTQGLLPSWLARFGFFGVTIREFPATQEATITWADKHHPLFSGVFTGETRGEQLPEAPRLQRLFSLGGGIPLLRSSAGIVLSEQRVGEGRLLFCGIAPDPSWGEFPRSGLFPTILVRAILFLGPAASPTFFRDAGETVALSLAAPTTAISIREPSGNRRVAPAIRLGSDTRAELGRIREPGVYELSSTEGAPLATLTVNIPTPELQLEYAPPEQIETWFRQLLSPSTLFRYTPSPGELQTIASGDGEATELWRYFLGLALLLAAVEVALGQSSRVNASKTAT
ncbi:MAG: BatA domain-containing protein [Candidatus Kapabacteria bacterium]|nr:BatA domain-containing protein [Candidatus Kapabacteria bacterium]